jgi:hypothetical protein
VDGRADSFPYLAWGQRMSHYRLAPRLFLTIAYWKLWAIPWAPLHSPDLC